MKKAILLAALLAYPIAANAELSKEYAQGLWNAIWATEVQGCIEEGVTDSCVDRAFEKMGVDSTVVMEKLMALGIDFSQPIQEDAK